MKTYQIVFTNFIVNKLVEPLNVEVLCNTVWIPQTYRCQLRRFLPPSGVFYFWESRGLLLEGATVWRYRAFWQVCSEWVQCVNAFRMGSSNLSFTMLSCTSTPVTLQVEIISLVVVYRWLQTFRTTSLLHFKHPI